MAVVLMSKAELSRVDTLALVQRGELPVVQAAALLGLSPRQVFRLLVRFRAEGASGLASRRRGRASHPRPPAARAGAAKHPPPAGVGPRGRARGRARALRRLRPDARGREAGRGPRPAAVPRDLAAVDGPGRPGGAAP